MPGHSLSSRTRSRNRSCTRVSPVSSGWNEATSTRPSRSSTGSPSSSASTSTPPARFGDPRRADEDAAQRLVLALQLEVGLEARDLAPVGVAADLEVEQAEVAAVEQDHPGAGAEQRPLESRIASSRPYSRTSRTIAVDSPPGITGRRARRAARACAPRPPRRRAGAASPRARGSSPEPPEPRFSTARPPARF